MAPTVVAQRAARGVRAWCGAPHRVPAHQRRAAPWLPDRPGRPGAQQRPRALPRSGEDRARVARSPVRTAVAGHASVLAAQVRCRRCSGSRQRRQRVELAAALLGASLPIPRVERYTDIPKGDDALSCGWARTPSNAGSRRGPYTSASERRTDSAPQDATPASPGSHLPMRGRGRDLHVASSGGRDDGVMGKYDRLAAHLADISADEMTVTISFREISTIVGGLSPTAYRLRQWWANDSKVEARAWRSAGWHVDEGGVDFNAQTVRFARGKVGGTRARRLGLG